MKNQNNNHKNHYQESGHNKGAHQEGKHEGHKTETFLKKFWVVLIITIPILFYSEIFEKAFGFRLPGFAGLDFLILFLATFIFFYGGWVFIVGAQKEIKNRVPGMMTLISLAITAAYIFSVFQTFRKEETLFWELSTLIAIMLLGHWIEMKAVSGAQGALKELAKLLPDTAEVVYNGKTKIVNLKELKKGDTVLVKPGAKIPADGEVIEGRSDIDESIITGESRPVFKKTGSEVIAGTTNGDGSLKVEVVKIGEGTFLAGVMRLVAEAQSSKSRLQTLSDRAALYLTIIAITAGAITLISWILLQSGVVFAVERMVAVLVIACPHALGLAVPLVASISTTMAAQNGFLVKQRIALEAARNIDIVLFDKTGTLTQGEFGVEAVISIDKTEEEVLQLAASVNYKSEHSLAKAITGEAEKRKIEFLSAENFNRIPGKGAEAEIQNRKIIVGSEVLLGDLNVTMSDAHKEKVSRLAKKGRTVVHVIEGSILRGSIALDDIIRKESYGAIDSLESMGIKTAMITGDSEDVALRVSRELKLDKYFARVLPEKKAEKVRQLQGQGLKVAMVGDGVNDAPALAQSDLGIAVGAGTNVAIESAGIILAKSDPRDIPKIIRLSKLTYKKMIQNLFWATGYNIIALPLAAGVLISAGVILQPAVAAIFMSFSTVIVAINAVLLRKNKIG